MRKASPWAPALAIATANMAEQAVYRQRFEMDTERVMAC
jgi:hypothetical protein